MGRYKIKKLVVNLSTILWLLFSILQGFGILGASSNPYIFGLPFSLFYILCMATWGILNGYLIYKLLTPLFLEKVKKELGDNF